MTDTRVRRLMAGSLISAEGISRNVIVSLLPDGSIAVAPFSHEIHSTPFIGAVAVVDASLLSPVIIKGIERISASGGDAPAVHSFLSDVGVLLSPPRGKLLAVAPQSIIIEM